MLKKIIALVLAFVAATAHAAIDANRADQARLESVKGVGTSLAKHILDERRKAPFKDWDDLIERVRGVGPASAVKLSKEGLTVNGASYTGAGKRARKGDASTARQAPPL
jgi:competence protein ComEA